MAEIPPIVTDEKVMQSMFRVMASHWEAVSAN